MKKILFGSLISLLVSGTYTTSNLMWANGLTSFSTGSKTGSQESTSQTVTSQTYQEPETITAQIASPQTVTTEIYQVSQEPPNTQITEPVTAYQDAPSVNLTLDTIYQDLSVTQSVYKDLSVTKSVYEQPVEGVEDYAYKIYPADTVYLSDLDFGKKKFTSKGTLGSIAFETSPFRQDWRLEVSATPIITNTSGISEEELNYQEYKPSFYLDMSKLELSPMYIVKDGEFPNVRYAKRKIPLDDGQRHVILSGDKGTAIGGFYLNFLADCLTMVMKPDKIFKFNSKDRFYKASTVITWTIVQGP